MMKQYKFSQLPYEANDYGSLQEKINTCTDQVRQAASADEIFDIISRYDDMMQDAVLASEMAYLSSTLYC